MQHQTRTTLPGIPDVESPLFEKLLRLKELSPETEDVARRLRRDGYAVIPFPDPDFDETADRIIRALDPLYDWDGWRAGRQEGLRVQDAWRNNSDVKRLAADPGILALLAQLYGREAFPFQTLNFPVGTQQHFHTDAVHFSSCPERFMAGVWVALEDTDSENGPLIYYPGTHALPIYTGEFVGVNPDTLAESQYTRYQEYIDAWESIVEALDLKPVEFHAKKGQALIWASNLLHGGAAQKSKNRTRYSQVTHYYFKGCCYYTPLASAPLLGPVLFRDVVDIQTGELVPNELNGTRLSREHRQYALPSRHRLSQELPADFDPVAYLKANPDVAAANIDPAVHWINYGRRENRSLR
ncbi:MAG TPA: phytanoyl-CoA dioxygenase family protein [Bryobacteraceae bacterium]